VAGIGNVFLGDDGFGVEVVRRIHPTELPDTVDVADFGIRGVHLAYELLDDRYDTLILVDAVPLGEEPATIAVLDASDRAGDSEAGPVDAHSMSPDVVLRALQGLGGHIARVLVVGCQPACIEESMGLSEPVQSAVDDAVRVVTDLARREAAAPAPAYPSTTGRRSP
jgi:hydrogenase maturation protease